LSEQWKFVAGYEGRYEVSDQGRVRNARTGRILAIALSPYAEVPLGQGKKGRIHKLVAEAFLGPADGRWVLHNDDDKANCRLSNLRYGTPAENSRDWSERQTDYDRIEGLYRAGLGSRRIAKWLDYKRQTVAGVLQRLKAA